MSGNNKLCESCQPGCVYTCSINEPFDEVHFQNAMEEGSKKLIGALFALENQGELGGKSVKQIVNNVFSYGYSKATLTCQQAFIATQTIDINCDKPGQGAKVKANPNCQLCLVRTRKWLNSRKKLDLDANQLNPNYSIPKDVRGLNNILGVDGKVLEEDFLVGDSGICQYVCEQCVALNLDQNIQFQINANCSVETPEFRRAWAGAMTEKAGQELSQHMKALQKTSETGKLQDLSIRLSNSITSITKTNTLVELRDQALIYQGIVVQPNSTSVVLQNVKQAVSMKVVADLSGAIYTSKQLAILSNSNLTAKVADLSLTLNDLYKELSDTYQAMQTILQDTLGQIVISIAAILITFILIFAVLVYMRSNLITG